MRRIRHAAADDAEPHRAAGAPEFLILPSSDGKAKPALGVDALPDGAQICSCNNVSRAQICAAVADGATTSAR
jgi:NAD(P)H-nitrite reductase large subunit